MKSCTRNILSSFIFLLCCSEVRAQSESIDSLKQALKLQHEDTNKVRLLNELSFEYVAGSYADTALVYSQQALDLAEKLNFEPGIFWSEITLGGSLAILGNYPLALEYDLKALMLARKMNFIRGISFGNGSLAECYYYLGDYKTSLIYQREVIKIAKQHFNHQIYFMWFQISRIFHGMGELDSALFYAKESRKLIDRMDFPFGESQMCTVLGNAYAGIGQNDSALLYFRRGIPIALAIRRQRDLVDNYNGVAGIHKKLGNMDSSLWYFKKVLHEKIIKSYPLGMLTAAEALTNLYELKNEPDSTLKYLKAAIVVKDSLFNRQKTIAIQNFTYKEQEKQKEVEAVRAKFREQLIMYSLLCIFIMGVIAVVIVMRNRRRNQFQAIRNNIADDLHDDIGSTLSSISIMNELAKEKSPGALSILNSIGESTQAIQENMSDIVWAIKADNDRFENVLQRMNQFCSEILGGRSIEFDFKNDSLMSARLTMEQRKNFFLFFKEVINNVARHSGATWVSIRVRQIHQYLEMSIDDNGKGFDTRVTYSGNGMNSLRKRAVELKADFDVLSRVDEGTHVRLKFKIT